MFVFKVSDSHVTTSRKCQTWIRRISKYGLYSTCKTPNTDVLFISETCPSLTRTYRHVLVTSFIAVSKLTCWKRVHSQVKVVLPLWRILRGLMHVKWRKIYVVKFTFQIIRVNHVLLNRVFKWNNCFLDFHVIFQHCMITLAYAGVYFYTS